MKSMSFRPTVFSYNATVLLIQPNPTHGWTQPMSISVVRYGKERDINLPGLRNLEPQDFIPATTRNKVGGVAQW